MNALTAPDLQAVILAASRHPHGGRVIGLLVLLVIVVVAVVLLMQRHNDRRPIADTQPTSRPSQASSEQPVVAPGVSIAASAAVRGDAHLPASAPRSAGTLPNGRYGLLGVIRSEWTKIRSVRSTMWTLGITVVLGIGVSALVSWTTQ